MHMDGLGDRMSPRKVCRALESMPEKLANNYNDALSRIKNQGKKRAKLDLQVLSWIYFAKQPFFGK